MLNNDFLILEFGCNNIKLVVAAKDNKGIKIKRMDLIPTIEGSISNGAIVNVDQVVGQISNHLVNNHISAKKTILTVTSPAIMMREADVLNHRKNIIESFIKIEARNLFPIDLSTCMVDYIIVPNKGTIEEEQENKILIVAIPKNIIEDYIAVANALGLKIHIIDIASDCISKLYLKNKNKLSLEKQYENEDEENENTDSEISTAFIDIGAEMTNMTIVTDGILKYNKILNFGVSYIEHAISIKNKVENEDEKQEENEYSIANDFYEQELNDANNLLKVIIKDFIDNLEIFINFHASRKTGNKIQDLILVGGGAYQKGLAEILEDSCGINVSTGFEFEGVNIDNRIKNVDKYILCFYNCFGASLKI